MNELVSVVLSTYNVESFISKTISSILNQSYNNIEIIIIDDGSTDGTINILKEYIYDSKFHIIFKEHTGNIGKNLNDCIKLSNGKIVAILGADDIWNVDKIKIQTEYLKNDFVICTNGNVIDKYDNIILGSINNYKNDFYIDLNFLLKENRIIASSVLAYKNILIDCGLFEEEEGRRCEDYALWVRIAEKYSIKYINQILTSYRVHGNNLTIKSNYDKIEVALRDHDIVFSFLQSNDKLIIESAKEGLCKIYIRLIKLYYKIYDFLNSIKYSKLFIKMYKQKFSKKFIKVLIFFIYLKVIVFFKKSNLKKTK